MLSYIALKTQRIWRKFVGTRLETINPEAPAATPATSPEAALQPDQASNPDDSFCIYPFKSLNILPSGVAKPCCSYTGLVGEEGQSYSVYDHTVPDLWNSKSMREIRRAFIAGENVPGCDYCFAQERKGLHSMRLHATEAWSGGFLNPERETIAQVKEVALANDFRIANGPEYLDLDVGNLCNLKCRMCNSFYSSMIANDPVHSKWSFVPPIEARWRGKDLVIAPQPINGAAYKGFADVSVHEGAFRRLTDGRASIEMSIPNEDIVNISMKLAAPVGSEVEITINQRVVFSGPVPSATWCADFETPFLTGVNRLDIELHSSLFVSEHHWVDFAIDEIRLKRSNKGRHNIATSRFTDGEHWFRETRFLIDELLAEPQRIRKINFIGGEPLLIREVRTIMRHLIDAGVAQQIFLVFSTNGTCADDEWFELCSQFSQLYAAVSLDGYGTVNDYIRFPSVWAEVERNLVRFRAQKNSIIDVNMSLQSLNMLNVADLVLICDRIGVGFRCHFLQSPEYLSPYVIPRPIRVVAAARIRELVEQRKSEASINSNKELISVASALEAGPSEVDHDKLREFMMFTNDLDKSRGQDIRTALPELIELLELHGYPWSDERKYCAPEVA